MVHMTYGLRLQAGMAPGRPLVVALKRRNICEGWGVRSESSRDSRVWMARVQKTPACYCVPGALVWLKGCQKGCQAAFAISRLQGKTVEDAG